MTLGSRSMLGWNVTVDLPGYSPLLDINPDQLGRICPLKDRAVCQSKSKLVSTGGYIGIIGCIIGWNSNLDKPLSSSG